MKQISTPTAPAPAGHYSQAVVHQGLIYVAGQVPRAAYPGGDAPISFEQQADLVFRNLAAILDSAGSDLGHVLKLTIYLTDLSAWSKADEICSRVFGTHRPARTTVPVPALLHSYKIEIDVIAAIRAKD
jgi:2-iminobutanoate/2-iminopropanoate deaminase